MDDLLALDGGGAATQWQKRHAKRKAAEAKKKLRATMRAEAKADLKKRLIKWRAKKAAAIAAGMPFAKKTKPRDMRKPQWIDMTGWRFGRLTVVRVAPVSKNGGQRCRRWWVKCDCGHAEHLVNGTNLRQGLAKSCGCLKREVNRATVKRRTADRAKLLAAPLSIQLAELRHRVYHGKPIARRYSKLLSAVRRILVKDEVRQASGGTTRAGRARCLRGWALAPLFGSPKSARCTRNARLTEQSYRYATPEN